MPTYDYECEACGRVIEVTHAMSEAGPKFCDCAERGRLHRLVSAGSGLIFKGSGFYITDYARKNGGNGGSNGDGAKSKSASSSSASSETCSSCCASGTPSCPAAAAPSGASKD